MVNGSLDKQPESGINIRPNSKKKIFTFDNDTTYPTTFYAVPDGKFFHVDDIIITGWNKNAGNIYAYVHMKGKNDVFEELAGAGSKGIGPIEFNHSFIGGIKTKKGNGSAKLFRLTSPVSASTNYNFTITLIGREKNRE